MTAVEGDLRAAREAYARGDWSVARRLYQETQTTAELPTDDLNALADASWWLGIIDESLRISEQVHQRQLSAGEARAAAMTAIGIGFNQMLRGQEAIGSGWLSRARRLLDEHADSVEHGYLLMIDATGALYGQEFDAARALAAQMMDVATQHEDITLRTLALFMSGSITVKQGEVAMGLAILDEAMLSVVAGELDPDWAGNLYYQMMSRCHELGDIDRSRQWTAATLEDNTAALPVLHEALTSWQRLRVRVRRHARGSRSPVPPVPSATTNGPRRSANWQRPHSRSWVRPTCWPRPPDRKPPTPANTGSPPAKWKSSEPWPRG